MGAQWLTEGSCSSSVLMQVYWWWQHIAIPCGWWLFETWKGRGSKDLEIWILESLTLRLIQSFKLSISSEVKQTFWFYSWMWWPNHNLASLALPRVNGLNPYMLTAGTSLAGNGLSGMWQMWPHSHLPAMGTCCPWDPQKHQVVWKITPCERSPTTLFQ